MIFVVALLRWVQAIGLISNHHLVWGSSGHSYILLISDNLFRTHIVAFPAFLEAAAGGCFIFNNWPITNKFKQINWMFFCMFLYLLLYFSKEARIKKMHWISMLTNKRLKQQAEFCCFNSIWKRQQKQENFSPDTNREFVENHIKHSCQLNCT